MIAAVLFDLGGVLLPFDQERRVAAIASRLGASPDVARELFAGTLPRRMDVGQADERDYATAFSAFAGREVSPAEARRLILSVFEAPNQALWDVAAKLRQRLTVGGFSDNPAFVAELFPAGATLDPMIFSSEIGAMKPSSAAFAAAEARLGLPPAQILFIDDSPANVAAARKRGWDAVRYVSNAVLMPELAARGLM